MLHMHTYIFIEPGQKLDKSITIYLQSEGYNTTS